MLCTKVSMEWLFRIYSYFQKNTKKQTYILSFDSRHCKKANTTNKINTIPILRRSHTRNIHPIIQCEFYRTIFIVNENILFLMWKTLFLYIMTLLHVCVSAWALARDFNKQLKMHVTFDEKDNHRSIGSSWIRLKAHSK